MKKAQSFISNKVLIQVSKQQPRKIIEQAGWFLRPDCAPRSECPSSRICGQNPRNDADATFLDPHIFVVDCRCAAHYNRREVAGMANFKMYLLHQFCLN